MGEAEPRRPLDNMTINDYHMVMRPAVVSSVNIAALTARLSHYLKLVRRGRSLTVLDRDTPVARIVPYPGKADRLRVRRPIRGPNEVRLPPPAKASIDSLSLLLEERYSAR